MVMMKTTQRVHCVSVLDSPSRVSFSQKALLNTAAVLDLDVRVKAVNLVAPEALATVLDKPFLGKITLKGTDAACR